MAVQPQHGTGFIPDSAGSPEAWRLRTICKHLWHRSLGLWPLRGYSADYASAEQRAEDDGLDYRTSNLVVPARERANCYQKHADDDEDCRHLVQIELSGRGH